MNRIVLVVVVVLSLGLVVPAGAAGSRPRYDTPSHVVAFAFGPETGEVVWNAVRYADFYEVDVSTSKSMSNAAHVITDGPGVNAADIPNLQPSTRYYVTVEVSSSRGESLSSDSKVASFTTDAAETP